jgi:hypothetical protein
MYYFESWLAGVLVGKIIHDAAYHHYMNGEKIDLE